MHFPKVMVGTKALLDGQVRTKRYMLSDLNFDNEFGPKNITNFFKICGAIWFFFDASHWWTPGGFKAARKGSPFPLFFRCGCCPNGINQGNTFRVQRAKFDFQYSDKPCLSSECVSFRFRAIPVLVEYYLRMYNYTSGKPETYD